MKTLPLPRIDDHKFPGTRKHHDDGRGPVRTYAETMMAYNARHPDAPLTFYQVMCADKRAIRKLRELMIGGAR